MTMSIWRISVTMCVGTHGGWRSLRRWLFLGVFSGAMMLGQVALAAGSAVQGAVVNMDAVLVGVITLAIFLWIYSMIA